MVESHHRLDGQEFEQALGVGDGQGSLECHSPWGRKESASQLLSPSAATTEADMPQSLLTRLSN